MVFMIAYRVYVWHNSPNGIKSMNSNAIKGFIHSTLNDPKWYFLGAGVTLRVQESALSGRRWFK